MKSLLRILMAGGLALLGAGAQAQGLPSKPVSIVVPFGPGSGSDLVSRIIAQRLSVALGQNVIVENKPGANGTIAAMQVIRSAPDGATIIFGTNTTHSAAPSLVKNLSYDPVKDFTPLSRVGSFTQMLLVNPAVPASSVQELIAYAKANPGKLTFASGNASSLLAGETLKRWAEIDMLHVPYRSAPPSVQDVLGGRVSMLFTDMPPGCRTTRRAACADLRPRGSSAARCCPSFRRSTSPG